MKRKGNMSELVTGIKGHVEEVVTEARTAAEMASGGLPVYATPRMTAMMENAAWTSVQPHLEEGSTTVGTRLEISHVSASPVGAHITVESELTGIDGRRLIFDVKAYDDKGLIGEGTHERFIIKADKFMARAAAKLEPQG